MSTGDSKQLCGGPSSLTIWRNTLYVAPKLSLPAGWAPADPLCIQEVPGRALTGSFTAADNMTVDSCVAYCSGLGFPYAGVEYGKCLSVNGSALQLITTFPSRARMYVRNSARQRRFLQQAFRRVLNAMRGLHTFKPSGECLPFVTFETSQLPMRLSLYRLAVEVTP